MMKVGHTPGPWQLSAEACPWTCGDARTAVEFNEEFGHTEILAPITAGDEITAYVPYEPLADPARAREITTNARLIAKAPELRAALEALFEHCSLIHKHWGEGNNAKQAAAAVQHARALLAEIDADTPEEQAARLLREGRY